MLGRKNCMANNRQEYFVKNKIPLDRELVLRFLSAVLTRCLATVSAVLVLE